MHISEFDYTLPPELIASEPIRPRHSSRMLVVDRSTGTFVDSTFRKIADCLRGGDVLVINDTRVVKARLFGVLERATGTSREIEVLFANPVAADAWEVLCKPGKRIRQGDRVVFGGGVAVGTFGELRDDGLRVLFVSAKRASPMRSVNDVLQLMEHFGHVPLPPYIQRKDVASDATDYQTVFATEPGAIAAPTAGLHFTPEVFAELREHGIETVSITLHVGVGTFMPVRTDDPADHRLRPERFNMSEETADRLNAAKAAGRRIIAVGTTSTRTLEYVMSKHGRFESASGYADTFILPGYQFRAIDGLLTNFHLPRSTLLMLVCAFASRELIYRAYEHAVQQRYRFYSFGDCMLLS
jgi:S-adenosylmethionine:tRNA ribosyltransferase-isomerase